jgi:hypothetical protein
LVIIDRVTFISGKPVCFVSWNIPTHLKRMAWGGRIFTLLLDENNSHLLLLSKSFYVYKSCSELFLWNRIWVLDWFWADQQYWKFLQGILLLKMYFLCFHGQKNYNVNVIFGSNGLKTHTELWVAQKEIAHRVT